MQKKSLFFGRFPQGEKGELQPIEWFVLKEENENKLLISKYALLCRAFHKGYNSCWETCDLRQYLNSEFYDIAFDQSEKERIVKAKLKSYIFNFNPISNIFDNYQEPAQEELYNTFLQFMALILKDIEDTVDALISGRETEYTQKLKIKRGTATYQLVYAKNLTAEEVAEYNANRPTEDDTAVALVVDFYQRFLYRMEYMLKVGKEKGYNLISFMGP